MFKYIRSCLKCNGLFVFTVEALEHSPMRRININNDKNNNINGGSNSIGKNISDKDNFATSGDILGDNIGGESNILGDISDVKASNNNGSNSSDNNNDLVNNDTGMELLTSARFAHSISYIKNLINLYRFEVMSYKLIELRKEEVDILPGHAYVLRAIM